MRLLTAAVIKESASPGFMLTILDHSLLGVSDEKTVDCSDHAMCVDFRPVPRSFGNDGIA
jgi:hypothetical protein